MIDGAMPLVPRGPGIPVVAGRRTQDGLIDPDEQVCFLIGCQAATRTPARDGEGHRKGDQQGVKLAKHHE